MTAAYHPSADGQAERSVGIVKVALRCMLVGQYEENWPRILGEMEYAYNTTRQSSTSVSPFEALYGFPPPSFLPVTKGDLDFVTNRRLVRKAIKDSIVYTNIRIGIVFNAKH